MTKTSSNLPVCIHCGTARPADESLCPNCGKPWIDVNVDSTAAAGAPAAPVTTTTEQESAVSPPPPPPQRSLDDTGEFDFDDWTLPPEPKPGKAKWLIPLILLVAVAGLWSLVLINRDGTPTNPTIAAADSPAAIVTTTTQAETTTTTEAEPTTTTQAETTTTTVAYPSADSWSALGDSLPVAELGLKASGVGPIAIGTPITDAAGALVASLGPAQAAGLDAGLCPGSEWYWLEWGNFRGIFDGYSQDSTFIAYRYEGEGTGTLSPILETLSGIRLGDTVETLQSTYSSYTVSFEVIDGKDHFRLSEGGDLLLWGPITSTEPQGTIEGVYSPDPCPSTS